MIYHLIEYLKGIGIDLPGQGLFSYLSFRAIISFTTALLISIFAGRRIIRWIQKKQIGEDIRDLGLEGQMQKKGPPTMGGIIIFLAIIVPILLFADLTNIYNILLIVSTIWFFIIGFYGGYIYIGLGFLILAVTVWSMDLDIITANVIKGFVIFLSTPFALAVFIYNGQVEWMAGLLHGAGNILGAVMASHWAMNWGVKFVRWFTLFIIVVFFIDLMGWISLQTMLSHLLQ